MTEPDDRAPRRTPPELRRQFWVLVGLFKVGLLASALGVLVLAFRSNRMLGVALVVVGVAAFVVGWRRFRRVRNDLPTSE